MGDFVDEHFTAYGKPQTQVASAIDLAKRTAADRSVRSSTSRITLPASHGETWPRRTPPRALIELWHEWARANSSVGAVSPPALPAGPGGTDVGDCRSALGLAYVPPRLRVHGYYAMPFFWRADDLLGASTPAGTAAHL